MSSPPTRTFSSLSTMSTHRVKIAARLRPRINGEADDASVKVYNTPSTSLSDPSSSGSSNTSFISVTNPRDLSQVFKFPCVVSRCYVICGDFIWVVFRFTSCYDQSSTQEEIFNNDVQPMIDVVYSGVVSSLDKNSRNEQIRTPSNICRQ